MGGHLSCMYVDISSVEREPVMNNSSRPLKVVLACEGRTCEFFEPVKVAELMLEFPNHFVVEFNMQMYNGAHMPPSQGQLGAATAMPIYSKRVSPLPADHDAKLSHVYLLLPMHRLNTRLSPDELSLISALVAMPAVPPTGAPPQCPLAKAAYTSSKVTPLSARHYQEAARAAAAAAHAASAAAANNVSIAKSYSVPILELLEKVSSMEELDGSENGNQHLHILRSKSWTPKLETIIENSQFNYL